MKKITLVTIIVTICLSCEWPYGVTTSFSLNAVAAQETQDPVLTEIANDLIDELDLDISSDVVVYAKTNLREDKGAIMTYEDGIFFFDLDYKNSCVEADEGGRAALAILLLRNLLDQQESELPYDGTEHNPERDEESDTEHELKLKLEAIGLLAKSSYDLGRGITLNRVLEMPPPTTSPTNSICHEIH